MMDCKQALQETDGDIDRAVELLREKGLASAQKRQGPDANQGLIDSYIHFNNTVGVLVEVNSETDFVANTDEFKQLVKDVALHIASPASPRWLRREDVPADVVEEQERYARAQAKEAGKPDTVIDKIVTGKVDSFYLDNVLLEQPFVKDDSKTINSSWTRSAPRSARRLPCDGSSDTSWETPARSDGGGTSSTRGARADVTETSAGRTEYQRVLLKLSGEAFAPAEGRGSAPSRPP